MLSDTPPNPELNPSASEIEPIEAEEAEVILQITLHPYLVDGWRVLDRSAFAARLTRGKRNLDFRIDLLGQVEIHESELTPLQESGRLVAWVVLLAMLLVTLALASALGIV
jgi:hypothetical protein